MAHRPQDFESVDKNIYTLSINEVLSLSSLVKLMLVRYKSTYWTDLRRLYHIYYILRLTHEYKIVPTKL